MLLTNLYKQAVSCLNKQVIIIDKKENQYEGLLMDIGLNYIFLQINQKEKYFFPIPHRYIYSIKINESNESKKSKRERKREFLHSKAKELVGDLVYIKSNGKEYYGKLDRFETKVVDNRKHITLKIKDAMSDKDKYITLHHFKHIYPLISVQDIPKSESS